MDNIKLFDLYSSFIFNELYKNFPKCIHFNDIDKIVLTLEKEEEIKNLTQHLDLKEKNIIFSETLLWLNEEGFVKFKTSSPATTRPVEPIKYQFFMCVRLSLKGLNLLTSPKPKALNKTKKLGEEIYEKIKQGLFLEAGKILTDGMFEFASERIFK